MSAALDIVVLGLSLRSSWGNGHATTWRALIDALEARGDRVLFIERDKPWYADNQDAGDELPGTLALYGSLEELDDRFRDAVAGSDLVIVGSYVPDGIAVGAWAQAHARGVVAFYDIDTPVTLAALERGDCEYLDATLVPGYHLYLSFTGGPVLQVLEWRHGAPRAKPLYCSADPARYFPEDLAPAWDLGYMGTYSDDRQPPLERMLLQPARAWRQGRFAVAGPGYPSTIDWPANVDRIEHLAPARHRDFYNRQRYTLNVTRADMVAAGWSPSVRLFEAAACGCAIISDAWDGLATLLRPDREILIAAPGSDVLSWLRDIPDERRRAIGEAARKRILAEHTAAHRAEALHGYVDPIRPHVGRSHASRPASAPAASTRRTGHEPTRSQADH